MLESLIALTIVEGLIFLGVVVGYLIVIMRRLRAVADLLAQVTFGVRAIEQQVANVKPHTERLNQRLSDLSATLATAEHAGTAP